MNVKEEKAKGLNKKYNVTLAAADFANAVDKKLEQVAKKIKPPASKDRWCGRRDSNSHSKATRS